MSRILDMARSKGELESAPGDRADADIAPLGLDIAAACGQLRGKEVAKSRATGGKRVILSREDGEGPPAEVRNALK